jgi:hypothetical protein
MTMEKKWEKKVMVGGRRSKEQDWWGKVILIGIFQSPPCLGFGPRMRNGLQCRQISPLG